MNYYEVLGFTSIVDIKLVKKRYKELAKQYHPDLNKSTDAEAKFKQINEAYQQILKGYNVAPNKQQPPKTKTKSKPRKTTPKKSAEQNIFRVLNSHRGTVKSFRVGYPFHTILAKTRFYFILDDNEFRIFFEEEHNLPATINVRSGGGEIKITIVEEIPF